MRKGKWLRIVLSVIVGGFLGVGFFLGVIFPPRPSMATLVRVDRGMNAEKIARRLKDAHVIRSTTFFVWAVYLGGVETKLGAGHFQFEEPMTLFQVISVLTARNREITVVIPEGYTIDQIGRTLADAGLFSQELFNQALNNNVSTSFSFVPKNSALEGYLFPDTYRIFQLTPPEEVMALLLRTFESKVLPLIEKECSSPCSVDEIITMASLLEREARSEEDMHMIAGILWRRLQEGHRLQVDATLGYITGKGSSELTEADLKNPSPYNTYVYKGLPPTPIASPGLRAIRAALNPTKSPYMFYLSDAEGVMHYARTFDEHKKNKVKYLK
ncbi:MAG: endolytic transglycosylase MltG [Patescibacteria group bacterium]